jgi:Alginate export
MQKGSLGSDRIAAWGGHWLVGYTRSAMTYQPRFMAEYNFASGDKNPHDGVQGTFDQLYPTSHDKYGLADQVGWRNIHDVRLAVELHINARWLVRPAYHNYWLASATDALYAANGLPIARRRDGSAGRRVGQETDLAMLYRVNKNTQVSAGFAHLFPGEFLKKSTPGHAYNYPYLMISYRF